MKPIRATIGHRFSNGELLLFLDGPRARSLYLMPDEAAELGAAVGDVVEIVIVRADDGRNG